MWILAKMMVIRASISNTKKFFKRKLESFKIFITGGYQKLPSRSNNTNNDKVYKDCALENLIEIKTEREDQRKDTRCPDINNGPRKGLSFSRSAREGRACLVGEKLIRELEIVDKRSINSVEHRLDVEEVLHYYSRLTCPAYRDIVDQFLVNLYDDIFDPQNPSFG